MTYAAAYVKKSSLHHGKRLKRFRSGAGTSIETGIRIKYSSWEVPFSLEGTERIALPPEAANELWERDYILSLYRLPLLRVVARGEVLGRVNFCPPRGTVIDFPLRLTARSAPDPTRSA